MQRTRVLFYRCEAPLDFVNHAPTELKITIFSFKSLITEPRPALPYNKEHIPPRL